MNRVQYIFSTCLIAALFIFGACKKLTITEKATFLKYYGGPYDTWAVDFIENDQGEFFILANTLSEDLDSAILLIKTDSEGNQEWKVEIGDTLNDVARAMSFSSTGDIIVAGEQYSSTSNNRNILLTKVSQDGVEASGWPKVYGNENFSETVRDLVVTSISSEYIYVLGTTNDNGLVGDNSSTDIQLTKFTLDGDSLIQTIRGFDSNKFDLALGLIEDVDGSLKWLGSEQKNSTNVDLRLLSSGEDLIVISDTDFPYYGSVSLESAGSIRHYNGGFLLPGSTTTLDGTFPIMLFALGTGDTLWTKQYSNEYQRERMMDVCYTTNSNVFAAGNAFVNESNRSDIILYKMDFFGDITERFTFGGPGDDYGVKILPSTDNGSIMLGTITFGNNKMACLIKTSENGTLQD